MLAKKQLSSAKTKVSKLKKTKKRTAGSEGKKQNKKKSYKSFKFYLHRILKQIHPTMKISSNTMSILNSFINDMIFKFLGESENLLKFRKARTLTAKEVMAACKLLLPGEIAKHAITEGSKAI